MPESTPSERLKDFNPGLDTLSYAVGDIQVRLEMVLNELLAVKIEKNDLTITVSVLQAKGTSRERQSPDSHCVLCSVS